MIKSDGGYESMRLLWRATRPEEEFDDAEAGEIRKLIAPRGLAVNQDRAAIV